MATLYLHNATQVGATTVSSSVNQSFFDYPTPYIPIDEPLTWHDGLTMTGQGALGQSVAVLAKA